jgi:alpha-glucosidase
VEPWLPVSEDYQTRNVAAQSADPKSILNLYRRLYRLRRESPALYGGSYRALDAGEDCYAYLRESGDQRRLVVLNFSGQALRVSIPGQAKGRVLLSTHLDREGENSDLTSLELRANEGLILEI